MSILERLLKKFDYEVPARLIAIKPSEPRDSAKLLIYDRKSKELKFDRFRNIGKYLPKGAVLVLNDTRVLPARLPVKKETGGLVRLLYIGKTNGGFKALSPTKLEVGSKLYLPNGEFLTVQKSKKGEYIFLQSFSDKLLFEKLEKFGETPLPPYIKNSPLSEKERREKYQTVFAKESGSVAAPTASLHFTKELLYSLEKSGIRVAYVTLHVNLGTFASLTEEHLKSGKLHKEYFEISKNSAEILRKAKKEGRPIIPVGTTALRTLESFARARFKKLSGETDIFIKEGDKLLFADGLITNFHVPRSSLLMLVSALVGRKKLLEIYAKAIEKKYKFFSFGDGMLVK